jgi:hypothetical protein
LSYQNHLPSAILLLITLVLSLCCGQSTEAERTVGTPASISFKVVNHVDTGFEGEDYVEIEMTEGTADEAILVYKPKDQQTVSVSLSTSDNITFSANVNFEAYQTEWFITASSSTATTEFGSSNDLLVNEKYMNKTNADNLILLIMNEKRSSSQILTYQPNNLNNTTNIQVNNNNIAVDHHVTIPITTSGFEDLHAEYVIEYNTLLDSSNNPDTESTTDTYLEVSADQTRDLGYIIIASTDRGSMEQILSNGQFFKDSIFLSEISGDNLQLIQY